MTTQENLFLAVESHSGRQKHSFVLPDFALSITNKNPALKRWAISKEKLSHEEALEVGKKAAAHFARLLETSR